MNQNTILPGADTGRDDCFSRESILEEDFCLEECLAAAEAGDPGAQGVLGDCYQYGWFVKKDYAAAVAWYEKAAKEGNAAAQRSLGWCWSKGRGVGPSEKKAVFWYTKAAEGGDADAQHNLGVDYDYGRLNERGQGAGSHLVQEGGGAGA